MTEARDKLLKENENLKKEIDDLKSFLPDWIEGMEKEKEFLKDIKFF